MNITIQMRWRVTLAAAMLAGMMSGFFAGECRASATESLANGAIRCAAELFQDKATHGRAKKLLQFGLAFDPDNTTGLLMQARMERNYQPIADPPSKSVLKPYQKGVLRMAERTSSKPHKLLLYRLIELLDPENKIALVALAKASNEGHDTDFDHLLSKVTGTSGGTDDSASKTSGNTRPPGPRSGHSSTVPTRPTQPSGKTCRELINQSDPLRGLRRKKDAEKIKDELGDFHIGVFPPDGISLYRYDWLNELNRKLFRRGYVILPFCDDTFSLSSVDFSDAGIPQFSGSLRKYPKMRSRLESKRKLGHLLAELCSDLGLGYRLVDGAVLLTDPDHADSQACASVHKGEELAREFSDNHLKAKKKYGGNFLVIEGAFESSGRSLDNAKLLLDDSKVELQFDKDCNVDIESLRPGSTVRAIGKFSHSNLGRIIIKDCIVVPPVYSGTHYRYPQY